MIGLRIMRHAYKLNRTRDSKNETRMWSTITASLFIVFSLLIFFLVDLDSQLDKDIKQRLLIINVESNSSEVSDLLGKIQEIPDVHRVIDTGKILNNRRDIVIELKSYRYRQRVIEKLAELTENLGVVMHDMDTDYSVVKFIKKTFVMSSFFMGILLVVFIRQFVVKVTNHILPHIHILGVLGYSFWALFYMVFYCIVSQLIRSTVFVVLLNVLFENYLFNWLIKNITFFSDYQITYTYFVGNDVVCFVIMISVILWFSFFYTKLILAKRLTM